MSRWASPNEYGEKPYVVQLLHWGSERTRIVYAWNDSQARFLAKNQQRDTYVLNCRRATPADIEAVSP